MTTGINDAIRLARLHALTDRLDGGSIQFWSGAKPATGATPAGVLQATSVLPTPAGAVANPSAGVITYTFGTIGDALRTATADVKWARFLDQSNQQVMDVDVGLLSAPSTPAEEILLSTISGAVGTFLHITTGTIAG